METFKEIVGWIKLAELAWDGFKQRLSEGWKTTGPKLSAAWDKISLAFSRVFEAGKRIVETMGLIPKSTEQNVGKHRVSDSRRYHFGRCRCCCLGHEPGGSSDRCSHSPHRGHRGDDHGVYKAFVISRTSGMLRFRLSGLGST